MRMQASIVAPIVGFIALILQLCFGIDLSDEQINIITDGFVAVTLAVATIYGAFKAYQGRKTKGESK